MVLVCPSVLECPSIDFASNSLRLPCSTWGYAIYRIAYGRHSNDKWAIAQRVIENAIYESVEMEKRRADLYLNLSKETRRRYRITGGQGFPPLTTPVQYVREKFRLHIFDDATEYNALSTDQIRDRYKKWAARQYWETGTHRLEVSDEVCIVVDDEVLESLTSDGRNGFVKVVEKDPSSVLKNGYMGEMKVRPVDLYKFYSDALGVGGIGYSAFTGRRRSDIPFYEGTSLGSLL